MQIAQRFLELVSQRGERRQTLHRVYRHLLDRELFLRAYTNLTARPEHAPTNMPTGATVDERVLQRIEAILTQLRAGTYQWQTSRGRSRPNADPLGADDQLVQEVLRLVLAAYYEPQGSLYAHWLRPQRDCHTALTAIVRTWRGTHWFIEGGSAGCFTQIDSDHLLPIIARSINDARLLKVLRGRLAAGSETDWRDQQPYAGTPQGDGLGPFLANLYLNEFDAYVATVLLPQYNRGAARKGHPETDDRRLYYVRYADAFLLGFVGPYAEAEAINAAVTASFTSLALTRTATKPLITNATTDTVKFLNYELGMPRNPKGQANGRRTANNTPSLQVPPDIVARWQRRYQRAGRPFHRAELLHLSDYAIVATYSAELQSLFTYYALAHDVVRKLQPVKYACTQSLVKTLASKHQKPGAWVWKNYGQHLPTGGSAIVATLTRANQAPLVASCGAAPLRFTPTARLEDGATRSPRRQAGPPVD